MGTAFRKPQLAILGSADPGSDAFERAAEAGRFLAIQGITVVSGCGSAATRVAAEQAIAAGGQVLSVIPEGSMPPVDWPATVVVPCGMGDARNLIMALAGDACIVIGGRAGTISEVCLAWLHKRPLLPLVGAGGWSDALPDNPPDERGNSPILPWRNIDELAEQLRVLGLLQH
ncbi:MAG: Rossmann fold nucleotide-binding protein [Stenotrophomonas sp.]|uniref:SLOG cluster 4 domain-containing protein n=1 Tax=Stenotrophomonas maltophilia TaxID=40324 RepID=UPI0015DBDD79|nr:Rossmann fold nucleotide-binding protein [Stenotrophomonas maltophilia]MBW8773731.1 Rossmann fold nucleotide-binding protein [Stenotrophomonas sp.]QDL29594.1 Rossmann fold nucleotide-binding protein [Stenotrophomonas maltophilia]